MKVLAFLKSAVSPFLEGIARNFDFAGCMHDFPGSPSKDHVALLNDWKMVGADYKNSLKIINEELHGTKTKSKK
jgi:hypothetical protein